MDSSYSQAGRSGLYYSNKVKGSQDQVVTNEYVDRCTVDPDKGVGGQVIQVDYIGN